MERLTSEGLASYEEWVRHHPQGSLWQSVAWKTFQEALGREVRIYATPTEGVRTSPTHTPTQKVLTPSALVVIDRTIGGFSTWDIPRGPLGPMENGQGKMDNLLEAIVADATKDRCISLYFSPQQSITVHCPLSIIHSSRHEQPEATRIIDLTLSEDALLAQMHPKGRYNISVAKKHGITIKESDDVDAFYELLRETAKRDAFRTLPKRHYETFLQALPGSFLLLAYAPPKGSGPLLPARLPKGPDPAQPVAGLLGVMWPGYADATPRQAYYYYGASNYALRANMAPYLLQWEAMRMCKRLGYRTYDLLGVTPLEGARSKELGAKSEIISSLYLAPSSSHSWSGLSTFKEKFGGKVVTYPGEQEIVLRPTLKQLLRLKRRVFR